VSNQIPSALIESGRNELISHRADGNCAQALLRRDKTSNQLRPEKLEIYISLHTFSSYISVTPHFGA
jgi:hypothetical protein